MEERDWTATATFLHGALDRVEHHIQDVPQSQSDSSVVPANSEDLQSTSSLTSGGVGGSARSEFNRLFGYWPDVSQKGLRASGKKRKGFGDSIPCRKRSRGSMWKKETVCLRFKAMEKIELAKVGLGLKDLAFSADGDAPHIHGVLLDAFKQLDDCGGYVGQTKSHHSGSQSSQS